MSPAPANGPAGVEGGEEAARRKPLPGGPSSPACRYKWARRSFGAALRGRGSGPALGTAGVVRSRRRPPRMQLGEPLLAAAGGALPGAPFYPLEGGGRGSGTGAGGGGGAASRGPPRPGSPAHLDLDKAAKKFAAAPAMLGEPDAGEPPFAAPKPDGRKTTPCGEEELPPAAAARYSMDSLSPERYYLQSPGPPVAELGGPCALFPYPPAAQHGAVYQAPGGPRYPYGSVLSSGGFAGAVCPPGGRTQFGGGGGYQYGQAAAGGALYGPYPPASGSCGGLGALGVPAAGPGLRAQVFLCNRPLWLKFHRHQTEMIITKQGR